MSAIVLEAETRKDLGKGASRRLRRLENKVPGIVYGGDKKPHMVHLLHNKVVKALENEAIFSSVFDLSINGKVERVLLKDLQRHPFKPIIMHMDLQRVSAKDVLVRMVPLHFTNEHESKGVKAGGMVNHTLTQVEIRCQAQHLPEFVQVDLLNVDLDEVLHLSDLKLPTGVKLVEDISDSHHNLPVVSIHIQRGSTVDAEEEAAAAAADKEQAESATDDAGKAE